MIKLFQSILKKFFNKKRIISSDPINGTFILNHVSTITSEDGKGNLSTIVRLQGDMKHGVHCDFIFDKSTFGAIQNIPRKYIITIKACEDK